MFGKILKLPIVKDIFNGVRDGLDALHYSSEEKAQDRKGLLEAIAKKEAALLAHRAAIMNAEAKVSESFLVAQESVLKAEMTGHSWLQRNWRPVAMIVFLVLIVLDILFKIIPEGEKTQYVYGLFQVGLGGYVIGRSAEKSVKMFRDNVATNKP